MVYKVNKGSFKVYYRQKGTTTELAEATVDNNDGQEYDVSFVNTFHAKDIAGYRPVKANLEATIQHKGVNEVVFEYEPVADTANPTTPTPPVAHPCLLYTSDFFFPLFHFLLRCSDIFVIQLQILRVCNFFQTFWTNQFIDLLLGII